MYKLGNKFIIWLTVLLLFVSGCNGQTPNLDNQPSIELPSTPTTGRGVGGTLHILYWDAPTLLNPHLTAGAKDGEVARITYEPLACFDDTGQLVPILATKIPSVENGGVASDGKSVTWKLMPDIQWSDGEPFTAKDVQFTYQFIINPDVGSNSASGYDSIENVEIIDDYTVKLNFKDVNPAWSIPFVGSQGVILPKHKFEPYNGTNARDAPANYIPVGTGPYIVSEEGIKPQEVIFLGTQLVQTNKIVFNKNPHYREEGKPHFDQIILRGGGTPNEAAQQVLALGNADYAWNLTLTPDELAQLETEGVGRVATIFATTVDEIDVNQTDPRQETAAGEKSSLEIPHPFFNDLKVRQAFAHAINREAILNLYGIVGEPTHHIFVTPPQFRSDQTPYLFDIEKATSLLDEAGWVDSNGNGIRDKDGLEMNVLFQTTANPIRQATQRIVQRELGSIGIDVEIKIIDAGIYYGGDVTHPDNAQQFQADLQEQDWTNLSPDPGLFLSYWTCEQATQKSNNWGGLNNPRWCNDEYDALFEQSKTELDPDKRQAMFVRMNDLITEDVALIPLARQARISGVSADLEGFAPTPWDAETWNIKDWRRSP
ncbi:peptide ABC transporter substrate-binding protein [Anaerolineales bacterium HSG25]|nr:peptide ABC transporter substrate-binding protein [Anaerolineales bacterium HSG25]